MDYHEYRRPSHNHSSHPRYPEVPVPPPLRDRLPTNMPRLRIRGQGQGSEPHARKGRHVESGVCVCVNPGLLFTVPPEGLAVEERGGKRSMYCGSCGRACRKEAVVHHDHERLGDETLYESFDYEGPERHVPRAERRRERGEFRAPDEDMEIRSSYTIVSSSRPRGAAEQRSRYSREAARQPAPHFSDESSLDSEPDAYGRRRARPARAAEQRYSRDTARQPAPPLHFSDESSLDLRENGRRPRPVAERPRSSRGPPARHFSDESSMDSEKDVYGRRRSRPAPVERRYTSSRYEAFQELDEEEDEEDEEEEEYSFVSDLDSESDLRQRAVRKLALNSPRYGKFGDGVVGFREIERPRRGERDEMFPREDGDGGLRREYRDVRKERIRGEDGHGNRREYRDVHEQRSRGEDRDMTRHRFQGDFRAVQEDQTPRGNKHLEQHRHPRGEKNPPRKHRNVPERKYVREEEEEDIIYSTNTPRPRKHEEHPRRRDRGFSFSSNLDGSGFSSPVSVSSNGREFFDASRVRYVDLSQRRRTVNEDRDAREMEPVMSGALNQRDGREKRRRRVSDGW